MKRSGCECYSANVIQNATAKVIPSCRCTSPFHHLVHRFTCFTCGAQATPNPPIYVFPHRSEKPASQATQSQPYVSCVQHRPQEIGKIFGVILLSNKQCQGLPNRSGFIARFARLFNWEPHVPFRSSVIVPYQTNPLRKKAYKIAWCRTQRTHLQRNQSPAWREKRRFKSNYRNMPNV